MSRNKSFSVNGEVYAQFPSWKVNLVQSYFENSLSSNTSQISSTTDCTGDVSTSIILDPSSSMTSSMSSLTEEDLEAQVDLNSNIGSQKSLQPIVVKPKQKFVDKIVRNEEFIQDVLKTISVKDNPKETEEVDEILETKENKVNEIVKIDIESRNYLLISDILNEIIKSLKTQVEEQEVTNVEEPSLEVEIEAEPEKPTPAPSGIIDIGDDDSSDGDLPVGKKIVVLPLPMKKNNEIERKIEREVDNFSRLIVDDVLEEILDAFVSEESLDFALEIIEECIGEVIDSRAFHKDQEDKDDDNAVLQQEKFNFPCSDIRYRSKPKTVIKENALSLFIFSPHTSCVSKFITEINNLRRRCTYERVGDCDQVVRMDYVFPEELDQKIFRNKVEDLSRPQELILEMKSVPEELLLHREAPVLSEEELLLICSDRLSENVFRGFSVRLLEARNGFGFEFESMMKLNTFLAIVLGLEKAFLGLIRKNARAYTPFKLKTIKFQKRYRRFPMNLKYSSFGVDMRWLSSHYGFRIMTDRNQVKRNSLVNVAFRNKKEFFRFLTSQDSKVFDQIDFEVESCI